MACYNPLWAEPYPFSHPKYGQYKVFSVRKCPTTPLDFAVDPDTGELRKWIRVPCGKCVGCRLDYSREWASRIVMESLDFPENSLFVTLTYDDEHIPIMLDDGSGAVAHGAGFMADYSAKGGTLFKKDLQKWFDRLRRTVRYHYGDCHIRYYAAGEYGSKTHRPHYHICLFGLPDDLKIVGRNKLGNMLYSSALIDDTWAQGHTVVGKLNYQTAAYTARYCLKKAQGQDHDYNDQLGINREFVTMSRKPGIGVNYFYNHQDEIYKNDEIILPAASKDKPVKVKPPRYFDILYKADNPRDYAMLKAQRGEAAELIHEEELSHTDLDEVSYFELQERTKIDQVKKLIRDL